MSKTVATCIAETNQAQNQPQENVFFLTLSRKLEDFPNEFLRTARSTSPIQVCAIFSTIGPDNLSAVLNLELNSELEKIVAQASKQPVLDFEGFSNQVVNTLNVKVCNFAANKGHQFKTSMTMFVIEGDILRVIHLGITKAVLFRDQRIMLLTEEQTVAHRYVQMGTISADEEKTHPENMNLTQYLGKMPQDGPVTPDKKIHLKLKDGDELFLMGLGISRLMPAQMRNSVLVQSISTEQKAKQMINSAVSYGVKSGLTLIDLKVESTFLLPGDAVVSSNLAQPSPVQKANPGAQRPGNQDKEAYTSFGDEPKSNGNKAKYNASSDTINFVPQGSDDDSESPLVNEKKEKIMSIVIPIVIFIACVLLGFGIMFLIFNMKNLIDLKPETSLDNVLDAGSVLYVVNDGTPVYSQATTDSVVIATLQRGDVVTLQEVTDNTFTKVVTADNVTGYIISIALSEEDPTYHDETEPMESDPTPTPTESSETTTIIEETTTTTTTAAATQATTTTTTAAATTTESTTEPDSYEAPTPTPSPVPEQTTTTSVSETPAEVVPETSGQPAENNENAGA